ncbi:YaiI/YqxD family protein [Terrilactibacillus laevilacticus]|uniref:YaiI/YqxD family protein n=1 Tax=Terrilactibacillus laevilacticus TaxID=1380157 RepID=UPI0011403201|nr:DUF188 domain-containing protein [Terrilactibacillus laevilacticus]
MNLYIDADACPVKQDILNIASEFKIVPIFVASYTHYSNKRQATWVFVDPDREAADLYIINHARQGDVVVTQDMGLASLLTPKGIFVLTPKGKNLNDKDMPAILNRRYLSYKALASKQKIKGPKAFTVGDHENFSSMLRKLLCQCNL